MMEYIILNFFLVVGLAISGYFFLDPTGGSNGGPTYTINSSGAIVVDQQNGARQYGLLVDAFLQRYRMMVELVLN